jgi:amino acid transporter
VGNVQGWTLFDALGFLDYGSHTGTSPDASLTGFAWMPIVAMMPAEGLGLGVLKFFFAIAGVLWLANDLPPFVMTSSRILFAMSFDRSLPEAFAKVDEKWHSPTNAIIFTAFVACLGAFAEANFFGADGLGVLIGGPIPILSDFMNPSGGIIATDLLDAVFFTTACVAAILLPSRLKDVYERSPWRPKIAGREGIVVMGWVALFLNLYIDLFLLGAVGYIDHITDPPIPFVPPLIPNTNILDPSTGYDFWTGWMVIGGIVIGFVIYLVVKNYYSKRGVDFSTIYASIPPE